MPQQKGGGVNAKGLGDAIKNTHRKRGEAPKAARAVGVADKHANKSILEQSSLEDFIAKAELGRATYDAVRGAEARAAMEYEGPRLVSACAPVSAEETAFRDLRARELVVPIPWRPSWSEEMSAQELAHNEATYFLEWRRVLSQIEEKEGLVMTPYEKNLDFWRQLWRTVDRSDLLVQILDARDPLFYRSRDLEKYVKSFDGKRHLLLLNKADFLTAEFRRSWASYFKEAGIEVIFFSALRELHRQERLPSQTSTSQDQEVPHGPLDGLDQDAIDTAQLMEELQRRTRPTAGAAKTGGYPDQTSDPPRQAAVGFVGYPNVGKSSVINALFGEKKVSMSRTPGKTKHLQTLELPNLTLCDCPGLVFPSVVATRAHLIIAGTVPLVELRDHLSPIRLVIEKIGLQHVLNHYGITEVEIRTGHDRRGDDFGEPASAGGTAAAHARGFLGGMAVSRGKKLKQDVPDEGWSAKRVLQDYCTGALLHCEVPPVASAQHGQGTATGSSAPKESVPKDEAVVTPAPATASESTSQAVGPDKLPAEEEDDFGDFDDFLAGKVDALDGPGGGNPRHPEGKPKNARKKGK